MATTPVPPIAARNALPTRSSTLGRLIRPLLSLLVLVVVAGVSATTTWLWTTRAALPAETAPAGDATAATGALPDTRAPTPQPAPPAPIFVGLDPFTVSLQSPEMERLLHVRMTLRVDDDTTRQRIERYMPEVRSRVLLLLSAQSPVDIVTPKGKTALADAVREALTRPFAPMPESQSVRDVLFTEFVVQ